MDREDNLGALWARKTKDGKTYFSGQLEINGETIRIVVFSNDYKKEDKHPDYRVYKAKEYSGEASQKPSGSLPASEVYPTPAEPSKPIQDEINVQDIPF